MDTFLLIVGIIGLTIVYGIIAGLFTGLVVRIEGPFKSSQDMVFLGLFWPITGLLVVVVWSARLSHKLTSGEK